MNDVDLKRAKILLDRGDFNKAFEIYQNIISSEPHNAIAFQYASVALSNLGRYSDALSMSTKALEIDPVLVIPHTTMALVYDEIGEKENSRKEAKIALDKNPESPEALCCSGTLSLIDTKTDDAIQYLEHAVKIEPSFYLAHYNLAAAYQAKKDSGKLLRQTIILFRLKPNIKSLFRLMFFLSRSYKYAFIPILFLSALLSPLLGVMVYLIITMLLTFIWFAGGIYIGLLAEKKQLKQLLFNIAGGIGVAILGLILFFSMNYFFGR